MTRPKVPKDKRQRTAQACDTCKRRKQKCNGIQPCSHCTQRNTKCTYNATDLAGADTFSSFGPPFKRRHVEIDTGFQPLIDRLASGGKNQYIGVRPFDNFDLNSHQSLPFGKDEETGVYGSYRTLPDTSGKRFLYFGESSPWSYLQLMRKVVEGVAGPSPFTRDPDQSQIVEPTLTVPETARSVQMLPERKTAEVLVQCFFTNTNGIVDIVESRRFKQSLHSCYLSPLTVASSTLCLVYLVLSIGLEMAAPTPGSPDHEIIVNLRSRSPDQAEVFFRSAQGLGHPVSGFEDGEFWSIQALCLMSLYKLTVCKHNAANVYLGMAVRSAQGLGLHRAPETADFLGDDQMERRNVWRSLFVLDRFLAVLLGRPVAISEGGCSEDSLEAPTKRMGPKRMRRTQNNTGPGLDGAVRASKAVGEVLKRAYSGTKITTTAAQELFGDRQGWSDDLHPTPHASKLFSKDISTAPAQGMGILHAKLLGFHCTILLTRPFFLRLFVMVRDDKPGHQVQTDSGMHRLSATCVFASTQMIKLTQAVFQSHIIPRRNPFVMHSLFAATIVILGNEFAHLHVNADYDELISNATNIMSHFSANDFEARRLLFIVTSFREAVQRQATATAPSGLVQTSQAMYHVKPHTVPKAPTESVSSSHHYLGESEDNRTKSPHVESKKSISQVSQAPMNPQEGPSRGMKAQGLAARGSTESPSNSTTPLSQATETSDQQGSDPGGPVSIGSEHGFPFDGFWSFPTDGGSVSRVQTPGTGPGGMVQIHSAETGGNAMGHSRYSAPGISDAPQNQSRGVVSSLSGVMYPMEDPPGFGR